MKRDPFMPSPEQLRRAEAFLTTWHAVVPRLGPWVIGACVMGMIVLVVVVVEWVSA